MDLRGAVTVVTGSTRNIGLAAARRFAERGAKVVLNSRSTPGEGEQAADAIRRRGGQAAYVQADVTRPAEVERLFEETAGLFGPVDILINNAGGAVARPFGETDLDYWLSQFELNFFSAVLCARAASRFMLEKGRGRIINTSSVRGLDFAGREAIMAYSAAKAALVSFTKTLARALAPAVTVNAVAPGVVATVGGGAAVGETRRHFIEASLIRREVTVDEVAEAFLYLAGAAAVTGSVLVLDGGLHLAQ
jgi:3-oxoacyl-[acyl-carrier protein] reductase